MLAQAQASGDIGRIAKIRRAQKVPRLPQWSQAEAKAMNWYAAHIVMIVRLKARSQRRIPAWENVVLLAATSEQSAYAKAEAIGRASEGDDDGSFEWGGRTATWEFAGVRKLTACDLAGTQPSSGDAITYGELAFKSLRDAKRYANRAAPK